MLAAAASSGDASSSPSKASLTSWWKGFIKGQGKEREGSIEQRGIFGIRLDQSIVYAHVAISLQDSQGRSFVYGYIPIVVAKCGVYLKDNATEVEGIFRLSGSAKRIKDLVVMFDSPPRYGKGLSWDGFTVHDAANVLRRYLNNLPEPIIPLDYYERMRRPLQESPFDQDVAITSYQREINSLPPINRQLLLYILDLLAVFASKSHVNRMNAFNLAAIFQPGIINHPMHEQAPSEYHLSQNVLVFLIEHQDHFLMGMEAKSNTEQSAWQLLGKQSSVQSTSSSEPPVTRKKLPAIDPNVSVRRNVSVSSRSIPSPILSSGALSRSNTMPSRRSPAIFQESKFTDPPQIVFTSSPVTPPEAFNTPAPAEPPAFVAAPSESALTSSSKSAQKTSWKTSAKKSSLPSNPAAAISPTQPASAESPLGKKTKETAATQSPSSSTVSLPTHHTSAPVAVQGGHLQQHRGHHQHQNKDRMSDTSSLSSLGSRDIGASPPGKRASNAAESLEQGRVTPSGGSMGALNAIPTGSPSRSPMKWLRKKRSERGSLGSDQSNERHEH